MLPQHYTMVKFVLKFYRNRVPYDIIRSVNPSIKQLQHCRVCARLVRVKPC